MTFYHLVKFVHVVGAIGIFCGAGVAYAAMLRGRQAQRVEELRPWAEMAATPARLLPLTILSLLLPGLYLAHAEWGWGRAWIDVALALYLLMLPLALAINLRRLAGIQHATRDAPDGPISASLHRQVRDPVLWTSVQTMSAIDLGIVFLMVVKPGFGGAVLTIGLAFVLGIAASLPLWRGHAGITNAAVVYGATPPAGGGAET